MLTFLSFFLYNNYKQNNCRMYQPSSPSTLAFPDSLSNVFDVRRPIYQRDSHFQPSRRLVDRLIPRSLFGMRRMIFRFSIACLSTIREPCRCRTLREGSQSLLLLRLSIFGSFTTIRCNRLEPKGLLCRSGSQKD